MDPEQPGMFAMVRRVRSNEELILGLREERQHHLQELTRLADENATLKAAQLNHRAQISMLETASTAHKFLVAKLKSRDIAQENLIIQLR